MNVAAIGRTLFLLAVANGAPVFARWLAGERLGWPVDCHATHCDGRAVLGPSKTFRGLATSFLATVPAAQWVGLSWSDGAIVSTLAMAGDLLSSYVKRRRGAQPSDQMLGLDQIPEALFPAVFVAGSMGLSLLDVLVVVGLFIITELAGSRFLYALSIKNRPY